MARPDSDDHPAEQQRVRPVKIQRPQILKGNSPCRGSTDVHNVAFSKPPIGKRGYNEDEVDQFLDLVEDALGELQDENADLRLRVEDLERDLEDARSGAAVPAVAPVSDSQTSDVDEDALRASIEAEVRADYERRLDESARLREEAEDRVRDAESAPPRRSPAPRPRRPTPAPSSRASSAPATESGESPRPTPTCRPPASWACPEMADRLTSDAKRGSDEMLSFARTNAETTVSDADARAEETLSSARREAEETCQRPPRAVRPSPTPASAASR